MKNDVENVIRWRCFSLNSAKDTQFGADFNSPQQPDAKLFKIHYLLSQPLTFGSYEKGVISFVVTGYEDTDSFSKENQLAMKSCLDLLVQTSVIDSFLMKEIESYAFRVTATFSVKDEDQFAVKMLQVFTRMMIGLHASNGHGLQGWLNQITFSSEEYIFQNNGWVTEENYYFQKFGLTLPDESLDESMYYKADIDDLF